MPKYVALIYGDETQFAHATPEDGAKMMKAYDEYTEALRASGIFEAGEGLHGAVRVSPALKEVLDDDSGRWQPE